MMQQSSFSVAIKENQISSYLSSLLQCIRLAGLCMFAIFGIQYVVVAS